MRQWISYLDIKRLKKFGIEYKENERFVKEATKLHLNSINYYYAIIIQSIYQNRYY